MPSDLVDFVPPFCPRPECTSHSRGGTWRYRRAGWYSRLAAPQRIPRYRCGDCGVTFSYQTFQCTYWLKRPDLLAPLMSRLVCCSGYRQIARDFGVAHTTVMRLAERLGRHCLLFLDRDRQRLRLDEPVAVDGFESFAYSQFHPFHFHVAVGALSHYTYAFTDSELRRKGSMTAWQRLRRQALESAHGRPDPRSIEKEVEELVRLLPKQAEGVTTIRTDDHRAYPRALRRTGLLIRHEVTPSTVRRTRANPLFPVNLLDLLIRHCSANHKRETIAFSKTRQNAVERLAVFAVWRNYCKSFSEKKQDATPAMALGLTERRLGPGDILSSRLLPWRIGLPERWQLYYRRMVSTGPLGPSRPHDLKLAY